MEYYSSKHFVNSIQESNLRDEHDVELKELPIHLIVLVHGVSGGVGDFNVIKTRLSEISKRLLVVSRKSYDCIELIFSMLPIVMMDGF